MSNDSYRALEFAAELHPELLGEGKLLAFRPETDRLLNFIGKKRLLCIQSWYPSYLLLQGQGLKVEPELSAENESFERVIVFGSKYKQENLLHMAQGLTRLEEGGLLICTLPNELGAGRFEKNLRELAGETISESKHKCRVFWIVKDSAKIDQHKLNEWLAFANYETIEGTELVSRPGSFGWNKIDRGSALLASTFSEKISGDVADLGCGYGFLACELLQKCPGIKALTLFEAEKIGLESARKNTARFSRVPLEYVWGDVGKGVGSEAFDWVITNPPFHEGKAKRTELGERFIEVAFFALKPGGTLILVANNQIGYEKVIREAFGNCTKLAEGEGFKVLVGVKG